MKRNKQAKARCLQVIRNYFNNASWLDTVFNHQDNPNNLSHIDYMFYHFEEQFYHNSEYKVGKIMRLEPLFCRLAFEAGFQQSNPDEQKLQRLNYILRRLHNLDKKNEINLTKINNLETITFDSLNKEYGYLLDLERKEENNKINNTEYIINEDYEIIGPIDYETAHKYGEYTCSKSKLCYTQSKSTWNTYTKGGLNNVYLILKKGFEEVPEEHNIETLTGYDDYGMSMLFIIVDNEGELSYCNNRWNHEGQWKEGFNCDFIMNKEMISELIGRNFNETFKSSNIKLNDILNKVEERLLNGEGVYDVFDVIYETTNKDFFIVEKYEFYNILNIKTKQLISPNIWSETFICYNKEWNLFKNKKYNFINTEGKLLSPNQWFDDVYDFQNGVAVVQLNGKWSWINTKGEYLFPGQWFDNACFFREGFALVKLNGKYNYINTEGEYLFPNQWFDSAFNFRKGFSKVRLNGKYNCINTEGEYLLLNQWFDYVYSFWHDFAKVELNGKCNYINTEGELLSPNQWFDGAGDFSNGFAIVQLNGKWSWINTKGEYLFPGQWFDSVGDFSNGFAMVKLNSKYNYINTKGEYLFPNQWFDNAYTFKEGFAVVQLNGKCNYINTEGELLSPNQWFDGVGDFSNGFAVVKLNSKYNYINTEGEYLLPNQWFDYVYDFREGFALVKLNSKYNYINTKGEYLFPNQWFDEMSDFDNGFAVVELNNKRNIINKNGNIILEEWSESNIEIKNKIFELIYLKN